MKTKLMFSILILGLFGCEKKTHNQEIHQPEEESLVRYVDRANGVVCYRVRNFEGLHCFEKGGL
jgi:hypothetical protein